MEKWDLYDKNRNKLDKIVTRGDKLLEEEFHLVVNTWVVNSENKFLISQRVPSKPHGLMWETTGGSVTSGEDSLTGAVREVEEELGVVLNKSNGKFIGSTLRYYPDCNDILDVWLFRVDGYVNVDIQVDEVNDYKWVSVDELISLNKSGELHTNFMLEEVLKNI